MSTEKVAVVLGASRGIGRQIAIDLAEAGYIVIVAAKSISDASKVSPFPPNPNSSQSTISTVAREITDRGGKATAIQVDVQNHASIQEMIDKTISLYSRIDVLVYNSGAIWWSSVATTPLKRFILLQRINPEGLYATVQSLLPVFERQGWNGRLIVISPPIYSRFFRGKTAYSMGKVGMSVLTMGLAMDWEREGKNHVAISSLWPAAAIQSAATEALSKTALEDLRHPSIFSDAILGLISLPAETVNGLVVTDEDFLREYKGVTDFSKYSLVPGATPRRIMPAKFPDLTVDEQDDEGMRMVSAEENRGSKL
ncbi:hypothetical protein RUND412_001116 [Rhizina undulata]